MAKTKTKSNSKSNSNMGLKAVCVLCLAVVVVVALLFLFGVAKIEKMQAFDSSAAPQTRPEKDALMRKMDAAYLHRYGSAFGGPPEKYAGASTMGEAARRRKSEKVGANLPARLTEPRLPVLKPIGVDPYGDKEKLTLDIALDQRDDDEARVRLINRDRYIEDVDTVRGGDKFVYVEKKVGRKY